MKTEIKAFNQLTLEELYALMRLRQEVFVVEQDCPYVDADNRDQESHHVLIYHEGILAAYARLVPKGISYEEYTSIGRVISAPSFRGQGYGKIIMQKSIDACKQLWPGEKIKISAQVYALPFYEALGFSAVGPEYLEDNIPHKAMIFEEELG